MDEDLAAPRQAAEVRDHQAADGVVLLVGKVGAEGGVEIGDLRQRLDAVAPAGLGQDVVARLVEVVLVLDVADDLLEHVLDGDQAGHAAVLVHDDRHVVAAGAEFAQQHVQALGLGHEDRRAQHLAHVERLLAGVVAQQVLGEQHADHVVAVLADHREARVRRADHLGNEILHRFV